MPLTNTGRNVLAQLLANRIGMLGVGDSSTAYAATQTDLIGTTNKAYEALDSAPVVATNVITLVATFETGDANFAWNEFGCFASGSPTEMYTRKVQSLGTKTSAAEWELTVQLTVAIGS